MSHGSAMIRSMTERYSPSLGGRDGGVHRGHSGHGRNVIVDEDLGPQDSIALEFFILMHISLSPITGGLRLMAMSNASPLC